MTPPERHVFTASVLRRAADAETGGRFGYRALCGPNSSGADVRFVPIAAVSNCSKQRPKGLCRPIHFRWMPSENDGPSELPDWFGGNLAFGCFTDLPDYCSAASRSAHLAVSRSA